MLLLIFEFKTTLCPICFLLANPLRRKPFECLSYATSLGSSAVLALVYLVYKWHVALDTPGSVIRSLRSYRSEHYAGKLL